MAIDDDEIENALRAHGGSLRQTAVDIVMSVDWLRRRLAESPALAALQRELVDAATQTDGETALAVVRLCASGQGSALQLRAAEVLLARADADAERESLRRDAESAQRAAGSQAVDARAVADYLRDIAPEEIERVASELRERKATR